METKKTSIKQIVIGLVALVAVIALLIGANAMFGPKTTEGAKSITIEVIDNEQKSVVYELNTDAEFLRRAMEDAEGLEFSGTESEYGLTLITVNGVTADLSVDNSYWSIMVNGEYGMFGVDSQPVADGDEYQLIYTVY